jgi:hypothetical protein
MYWYTTLTIHLQVSESSRTHTLLRHACAPVGGRVGLASNQATT